MEKDVNTTLKRAIYRWHYWSAVNDWFFCCFSTRVLLRLSKLFGFSMTVLPEDVRTFPHFLKNYYASFRRSNIYSFIVEELALFYVCVLLYNKFNLWISFLIVILFAIHEMNNPLRVKFSSLFIGPEYQRFFLDYHNEPRQKRVVNYILFCVAFMVSLALLTYLIVVSF